jgi:hypothetical protein
MVGVAHATAVDALQNSTSALGSCTIVVRRHNTDTDTAVSLARLRAVYPWVSLAMLCFGCFPCLGPASAAPPLISDLRYPCLFPRLTFYYIPRQRANAARL